MKRLDPKDGPLLVASHNIGKIWEIRELMEPFGFEVTSAKDKGLEDPEETGTTFEANAELKALAAMRATGLVSLSDDSGIAIDALNGDPGIYSARWGGPDRDFAMAMRNVEEKLQAAGATTPEQRRAKFVAVLCLADPAGGTHLFRGEVEGTIVWPPRGELGFGYDPIFLPDGSDRTFGEMMSAEKHAWKPGQPTAMSHRARAFQKFARDALGVE
ncbi:MAG: RdgB/HAM1 family non-canonical purine NTP pyrophosphatase [Aurantimonas coralicida]|jgi:XTP/dITP diphosphohydrolase|uniref:RdgB/HAM1 family non-canonical purine NTP pyrophosphatase n=1 Tax=Aurantimonas TaxID=182269 RepID=UPI00041DAE4F|nr:MULTISPECIES: RdgB/HAM1 family non-canonical purine NTP pyrophosphatase [Aurantimonas]MAP18275.1 non-canonical purine NTP pyrophosphatase, RdgB/HAM1 family [Aurantimonas sp.]MCW7544669.1 RdgB/HAM1 family non-canonical purine NTP pyrophosphatase [Aurantimonas litoralis]MBC6715387.1 RdgB/HAM1 family non-canonical purine NTP pyrophosphatase [Aurantimonas sp. DM33-3]MCC4296798.1 RdgB/HAM1 family non-canonical purine NTP pyrophosphatase [Aurantimonas coralicida]MCD1644357.1 RdgB/HAM1 family non-